MHLARLTRVVRLEATLAAVAYVGLLLVAHPDGAARVAGLGEPEWTNHMFDAGLVIALAALGCLVLRLTGRLVAHGRRNEWNCGRAVSGTVMAEFALVIPLVLLAMSFIVQLALIANASIVVRYAAFAAARSAIVSFQAEMPGGFWKGIPQFPPFPEVVDVQRPTLAARLVLTSISPRRSSSDAAALAMEHLLQAQPGATWQGRRYADRFAYASAATRVSIVPSAFNKAGQWWQSYPPLIPRSEHLITPYGQKIGEKAFYIAAAPPPLIPTSIQGIPLPAAVKTQVDKINALVKQADAALRTGAAKRVDKMQGWKDLVSPKRVAAEVEYDFMLTLPSLQIVPRVTSPAPIGNGRVITLKHTVWLQSTGGRKASLLALVPWPKAVRKRVTPIRDNSPMFWTWPP